MGLYGYRVRARFKRKGEGGESTVIMMLKVEWATRSALPFLARWLTC